MEQFAELSFAAFAAQEQGSARLLVLTVNNRHARRLVADLTAHMQGRAVRQMPRIVPLSAWMRQAAESLVHAPGMSMASHVLDGFGVRQLWTRVIQDAEAQRPLLDVGQAAGLAMDADRLCADWDLHVPDGAQTEEYARFRLWRRAYLTQLAQLDAQDDNRLQDAVREAASRGVLPLPFDVLVLAGFTELPPRVLTVLQHAQQQGRQVLRLRRDPPTGVVMQRVRTQSDDPESQWRDAAAWAAHQLRALPQGRFAIVAAQLEADMPFAHRVLRQALGHDAPAGSAPPQPYNIAVARPLAQWPLARAAMAWLEALSAYCRHGVSDPQTIGAALLSGACAGQMAERAARAGIDAAWRRKGVLAVTCDDLADQLRDLAPALGEAWAQALTLAVSQDNGATLDAWANRFRQQLQALGFPGDSTQDSEAFQTLQALDEALDRMAAQAFAFGEQRRVSALAMLGALLRDTPFQPMRDPSARLDVLGMLEADGGHWDAVWVLGLQDDVLPAVARPNPLLPLAVLRQAGTPRATPARELQWAQSMLQALAHCAPRMVFSHAARQGEQPLRPSPLILDVDPVPVADAVADAWDMAVLQATAQPAMATQASGLQGASSQPAASPVAVSPLPDVTSSMPPRSDGVRLESLLDTQGPPLPGDRPLQGGIGVLDTQARNPLWAFVKYRLGGSELPGYAQAADANTRGNFLHHCIELVWRMLPDQSALHQQVVQGTLDALVSQAVAQAAEEGLPGYGAALKALECRRAEGILEHWLQAECAREPFRIQALEHDATWNDGPLALRVRVDRIDALDDGRWLVIDYKTGAGPIDPRNDWTRARPVSLQLPFYAALLEQGQEDYGQGQGQEQEQGSQGVEGQGRVAALVLARLHARTVEFRGLADADGAGWEGVAVPADWQPFAGWSWDDVMRHWRETILALAREVAQGEAPNIVWRATDLAYCDALPFLRLNENGLAQADEGDDDA